MQSLSLSLSFSNKGPPPRKVPWNISSAVAAQVKKRNGQLSEKRTWTAEDKRRPKSLEGLVKPELPPLATRLSAVLLSFAPRRSSASKRTAEEDRLNV